MKALLRSALIGCVALGAIGLLPASAKAEEPYANFLKQLRLDEMHDVAIAYLESLKDRQDLDPEIKTMLTFEEGLSYLASSRSKKDPKQRFALLDKATEKFDEFIKNNPSHPRVPSANAQLGEVLVERAKFLVLQADSPRKEDERPELLKQAQAYYNDAIKALDAAEAALEKVAYSDEWMGHIEDRKKREQRDKIRQDYIGARVFKASVRYLAAQAYEKGDKKREELLKQSAEMFKEMGQRWRTRLVGQYAQMWEGRSLQELGGQQNLKQAQSNYDNLLLTEEADAGMRAMQFATVRLYLSLLLDAMEEPNLEKAIDLGRTWVERFKGAEDKTEDGLAIQWKLSQALLKHRDTLDDDREQTRINVEAGKYLEDVARLDNPFKNDAVKLLADLRGKEVGDPKTFDEAFNQVKQFFSARQQFSEELATASDQETQAELQKKVEDADAKLRQFAELALRYRVAEDNKAKGPGEMIDPDKVNQIYYYLCALDFLKQKYLQAAVVGEYLARQGDESAFSRYAASVTLSCYGQLYNAARGSDSGNVDWETSRMEEFADYMIKQWPNDPVTEKARVNLLKVMIRSKNTERVRALLNEIPEDSTARADAEISVGDYLWKDYLLQARKPEDIRLPQEELDALAEEAKHLLISGMERKGDVRPENIGASALMGKLSLAQVYARQGELESAKEVLEKEPDGLMVLLKDNHPLIDKMGNFRPGVLKIALQTYVNAQEQDKALSTMEMLEEAYADQGAQAQAQLTQIYISMGKDMQEDLQRYRDSKSPKYDQALDATLAFLERIGQRQDTTFNTLAWISSTFYELGEIDGSAKATPMYKKALSVYQEMLTKPEDFWPEEKREAIKLAIRIQVAKCHRGLGDFEKASDLLIDMLEKEGNGSNLSLQTEAAMTFQEWGDETKDTAEYAKAMMGVKDSEGKRVVWGWQYMSKIMQNAIDKSPLFKEKYFESYYNFCNCLHKWSNASEVDKRASRLRQTATAITSIARVYPTLGGEDSFRRFNELLKRVERDLGQPVKGLPKPEDRVSAR